MVIADGTYLIVLFRREKDFSRDVSPSVSVHEAQLPRSPGHRPLSCPATASTASCLCRVKLTFPKHRHTSSRPSHGGLKPVLAPNAHCSPGRLSQRASRSSGHFPLPPRPQGCRVSLLTHTALSAFALLHTLLCSVPSLTKSHLLHQTQRWGRLDLQRKGLHKLTCTQFPSRS